MCSYFNTGCCPYVNDDFCIHVVKGKRSEKWHLCNLKVPKEDREGNQVFAVCGKKHMPYDCPYWNRAFQEASKYQEFAHRFRMEGPHAHDRGREWGRRQREHIAWGPLGPRRATPEEIDNATPVQVSMNAPR